MPYSTSVPITRRTLMCPSLRASRRAGRQRRGRSALPQLRHHEEQHDGDDGDDDEELHGVTVGVARHRRLTAMGAWTDHVVPRLNDASLKSHELGELRREACAPLTGRVIELGFGSGLNVRWYPPGVTSVSAVEPSDLGWRLSARRRARTTVPVERRGLDGQRLDEPDASYDSALSTFTLCTVREPALALAELRRVL